MRHLIAAVLLAACSSSPTLPPRDCTPGQASTCACVGGAAGAQTCGADGVLGACVCPDAGGSGADVERPGDAVAGDAPDVAAAPTDAPGDVPATATDDGRDPRCGPGTLVMCLPGSCWDLQTSNGRVPATHCGACGNACPEAAPECVGGRCTVRTAPADAGR